MFGGLKNATPKAPSSVPNGNMAQGSKTPIDKGTQSKLSERGMDLQLFGNKKGSPNVGGSAIKGATQADKYADAVNSNKVWSWAEDIPGGAELTAKQRKVIRQEAIERGLIPDVKMKPGTKYPDFEGAGLVKRVEQLPEELWNARDKRQFKWLDDRIEGGRPEGTTWHHSEIDGRMELVPFGIHNIINHNGGRSLGNWSSYGKR